MNFIFSRKIVMHIGDDKSRLRFLIKNGVPQGSVLAPILFNVYTADLPHTDSKKYIYANDIALMTTNKFFPPIESMLSANLDRMSTYFDNCAPTWFHSCHTNKVDIALNATMRIVTGCLKSTPTLSLPIDSGIQPPDI